MPESKSLEGTIDTITGNITAMARFEPGSWQSSAQVMKDRISDASLRSRWFYTNNHSVYDVEDGEAILYFGSNDESIFRAETIDNAFKELRDDSEGNYYRPPEADVAKAKGSSLRLKIADLKLKYDEGDSYGYFEIDTFDRTGSKLNDSQRKFAEAVYGSMVADESGESDYSMAMDLLANKEKDTDRSAIKKTRIYALRDSTVLRDAVDAPVARACWLSSFDYYSDFDAVGSSVDDHDNLRGVLRAAEGGAPEKADLPDPLRDAYKSVLGGVDKLSEPEVTELYNALHPRVMDLAKRPE